MTGRMMTGLGKNRIEMVSGLVLSMTGPVTGLGLRTTGVLGLRTGPGTLRNGGVATELEWCRELRFECPSGHRQE